jgi:LysR family transcriptional regulator, hydrogen peroxide-inducible genes activator
MDLQRLKYFVEVARQRHFSRAAEVCRVSQPSLSQQIKKLEDEVGGPLFQRTRGNVTLTVLGEAFLKHAQAILAEVQSAEEFVNGLQDDQLRLIRIGAIPTIAPYLIPSLFETIRSRYPAARLELVESVTETLTEALLTGRIDFALLSPPTAMDDVCDSVLILQDELLLTLPETDPLAKQAQIHPSQLVEQSILLLEHAHCLAGQMGAFCEKLGLGEPVAIRGSQIDTLLGLVERGFGLTFTPALAAKSHRDRKVVFRGLHGQAYFRDIRLMWLKRQFLTRSQRLVLEAVQDLQVGAGKG